MPAAYSYQRPYGQESTIPFPLYDRTGNDFDAGLIWEAGDTKILTMGNETGITSIGPTVNNFVPNDGGYVIVVDASELRGQVALIYVIDQSNPKKWIDTMLVIETYGHPSAAHPSIGDATVVVAPV